MSLGAAACQFMIIVYCASVLGAPTGAGPVAWSVEAMWLLVAWGYRIDNHRRSR